jgi:hypothetical protein
MLEAEDILKITAPGGNFRDGVRLAREYRVVERR